MAEKNEVQNLGNQAVMNSRLLDPVTAEQQARYSRLGLNYISNNTAVVPRDEAGNITLNENSKKNPLLIIDSSAEQIATKSVLRVLNTRFQYYSFPTELAANDTDLNLDVDLNLDSDTITTELKIPVATDEQGQPIGVTKINTTYDSIWYYGEESENSAAGFRQLQFTGGSQPVVNGYTITKDILSTLRNSNRTLRFVINTQYVTNESGQRTGISLKLSRRNPKIYREFEEIIIYTEANASGDAGSTSNPNGFVANTYPVLLLEYFVDAIDIQIGDTYFIEAVGSNPTWTLPENSYWTIEPVDIPTGTAIFGWSTQNTAGNAGVYNLNFDTILYNNSYQRIATRNLGTNQVLTMV